MKAGCDSRQRSVAARRATTGSASSIAVAPPTATSAMVIVLSRAIRSTREKAFQG